MKVVKNVCFGGFNLSDEALARLSKLTGKSLNKCWADYVNYTNNRTAPELIQVVEELGNKANGTYAKLVIVEVPDDAIWTIEDYDGMETIEEVHRVWQKNSKKPVDKPPTKYDIISTSSEGHT